MQLSCWLQHYRQQAGTAQDGDKSTVGTEAQPKPTPLSVHFDHPAKNLRTRDQPVDLGGVISLHQERVVQNSHDPVDSQVICAAASESGDIPAAQIRGGNRRHGNDVTVPDEWTHAVALGFKTEGTTSGQEITQESS
jgi:hypothetical protein